MLYVRVCTFLIAFDILQRSSHFLTELPLFKKIFFKDFIYFYREGKGRRKRGKYQCVIISCVPPTGDLACNPGICPDWESNQQPFGSQAGAQSTEPHQPGTEFVLTVALYFSVEVSVAVCTAPGATFHICGVNA